MKKQFSAIVFIAGVIFCVIGSYIGYNYSKGILNSDQVILDKRINELFHEKNVIQDGYSEVLSGLETKTGYSIFSGGFIIYKLSKESDGFVKSEISPKNIIWLKGKYENQVFGGYSYNMPTYRPTPVEAYQRTLKYLLFGTEKEPNHSYTRETFTEIKNFPGSFSTEYHNIIQSEHPTELYITRNVGWEQSNDSYKISYNEKQEFFTLMEIKSNVANLIFKNIAFGLGGGLILTIILLFILRLFIQSAGISEPIFQKKWKNIETNSIMIIEPKLFGKNEVTIVEGEKIKRGIAKFTDKGFSIHLSFPDSEFFYRFKRLLSQKLELENLTTNQLTKFELLGSNAYKETNLENEITNETIVNSGIQQEPSTSLNT